MENSKSWNIVGKKYFFYIAQDKTSSVNISTDIGQNIL